MNSCKFVSRSVLVFSSLLLLQGCNAQGSEWTSEETAIIGQKIDRLFKSDGPVINNFLQLHPNYTILHKHQRPNFHKVLRLGFHDCLKYENPVPEGQANGCDGCLNSEGMGINMVEEFEAEIGSLNGPNVLQTNNNGLLMTADILEEIYTNPNFPAMTPTLPISMKESGKSRADLWAFAALKAAQLGIDNNNQGCQGTKPFKNCGNLQDDLATCQINMPRNFIFKTGRIDCIADANASRPFLTTRAEIHPNAAGNGPQTTDFFREHFNLTGRETIALVGGAHSLGGFHIANSLHVYRWTRHQESILNNQLIRHYAEKEQYFYECYLDVHTGQPLKLGDAFGNKAKTSWTVKAIRRSAGGGPFQWFHTYERCPASDLCLQNLANVTFNFERSEEIAPDSCCQNLDPGMHCQPQCVAQRTRRENAISAETGFYRKFQTDPVTGRPIGCPAFDHPKWLEGKRIHVKPDCDKEDYAPEGQPLFEIVEEFADDQQAWISTFVPSLEKMLENGYGNDDLITIDI